MTDCLQWVKMKVSRTGRVEKRRTKEDSRDRLLMGSECERKGCRLPFAVFVSPRGRACRVREMLLARLGVNAGGQQRRHGRGNCC
jgi:hypothetical protein